MVEAAGRIVRPISLAELIAIAQRAPAIATDFLSAAVIAPAGSYDWSKPVSLDMAFLDPNLRAVLSGYYAATHQTYDDVLRVVLQQALVTTHGAVITQDGHLLRESCWEFIGAGLVPHGLARRDDGLYDLTAPPTRHVRDPALLLKRPWWRSYRHFLIDAASLLAFAATQPDVAISQLVIGKEDDAALRRSMLDLIEMVAPGAAILEQPDDEIWRFSALHYITPVYIPPICKLPRALSALRACARTAAVGAQRVDPPMPRLLLLPDPTERPRLSNQSEIVAICAEFGFAAVYPDRWRMVDRIALVGDATIIVSVKTTQLANIVFCSPGTLVIALSPGDWPDPFYAEIAGQLGLRYADIFGPPVDRRAGPSQNPFRIDPTHFCYALTSLLATDMPSPRSFAPDPAIDATLVPAFERFLAEAVYPEHQGAPYLSLLGQLHKALRPRSYLEIGTQYGDTLALAQCVSLAIDPHLLLRESAIRGKLEQFLFRMTSDTFFSRYDPMRFLGGAVMLAFLDGPLLHFERILRDFMNLERFCSPHAMVLIHGVVPLDFDMACRDQLDDFRRSRSIRPTWWTGDVWKLIGVLQKYRPDLVIDVLDAAPSGLMLIQGIDPASTVLSERYDQIVQEVTDWPDEAAVFADFRAHPRLRSTAELPAILAERERRALRAP